MPARRRIDKLTSDAHPVAHSAHASFKHVAHSKVAAYLLHIDGTTLEGEGGIPAITNRLRKRLSSVMMSSVIPSLKYSCCGSPLMFTNGRMATVGLRDGLEAGRSLAAPPVIL